MNDIKFLQVPFSVLPAGTMVKKVEPDSAMYQARAMVGSNPTPFTRYVVVGDEEGASIYVPAFEGIVGDLHPQDPKVIGPFVVKSIKVDYDRLPEGKEAQACIVHTYPTAYVSVCIDDRLEGVVNKTLQIKIIKEVVELLSSGNYINPNSKHIWEDVLAIKVSPK